MEIKDGGFYNRNGSMCRIYRSKTSTELYVILYYNKTGDIGLPLRGVQLVGGINCEGFWGYHYLSKISTLCDDLIDLNDIPLIKAIYGD